ncbi:capsular polysaccharide biosynthesis protein [Pseudooceanicola aestuarii]|uniref:capsular polysaccharide biosynthesis protein n=1 Tax=Pseudooceanicola aestuarii TaxID=2697319 RepID=UPI0013D1927B|nr:capsular polysaccharide biosynthesis protein [Pseudooceanicola aestuarii]
MSSPLTPHPASTPASALSATPGGADTPRQPLHVFSAGFVRQRRLRRILSLAGYDLRLGWPGADGTIAVWGHSPYAARGESVAARTGAALLRVEDAPLRSLFPGRGGEAPLGLIVDPVMPFDARQPSGLERLLADHPLDDTALLDRARAVMARLREGHLSKYSATRPDLTPPEPGYVLVIDQTRGDASITLGGGDENSFREMLYWAQEDHPAARIVIKTHPETAQGHRQGHFDSGDAQGRISLFTRPISPWVLMENAVAVYTVTSQMGAEAIIAGHRPVTFGQPWYAGWGLTDDRHPLALGAPRRGRRLTPAQMVAAALILHPLWYDAYRDRLCQVEDVLATLEARSRAWREDRDGWTGHGMRLWKRPALQGFFGGHRRMTFANAPPPAPEASGAGRRHMAWAARTDQDADVVRVEDGFLRSRGLGAALVPPLSLVLDDLGIYYDPSRESRLERLIAERWKLRSDQELRAEALVDFLTRSGLSKYNTGQPRALDDLPPGPRILVPGQVEDDASIRLGAGQVRDNLSLLRATREARPDAVILYKPHPDVEAGLRPGQVPAWALDQLADRVLTDADPASLLPQVTEVWTMTSLLGFEALLRGLPVTVLGQPFYAGWGLTRDLGAPLPRRVARPGLAGLVHATLIDYPRYRDPVTGLPCPVEVAAERLVSGAGLRRAPALRMLSRVQGLLASRASLWR